jgi:hypothetical protein
MFDAISFIRSNGVGVFFPRMPITILSPRLIA